MIVKYYIRKEGYPEKVRGHHPGPREPAWLAIASHYPIISDWHYPIISDWVRADGSIIRPWSGGFPPDLDNYMEVSAPGKLCLVSPDLEVDEGL